MHNIKLNYLYIYIALWNIAVFYKAGKIIKMPKMWRYGFMIMYVVCIDKVERETNMFLIRIRIVFNWLHCTYIIVQAVVDKLVFFKFSMWFIRNDLQ